MKKATITILVLLSLLAVTLSLSAKTSLRSDSDRLKSEYMFVEAESRLAAGDRGGIDLMRRALELNPDDEELSYFVSRHKLMLGSLDSATFADVKKRIRRMVELHPDNSSIIATYAQICSSTDDLDEVVWALSKNDSLHPDDTRMSIMLGKVLTYLPDSASQRRGIEILNRESLRQADYPETASSKIAYYFMNHDTASVVREIDDIIAKSPNDPEMIVVAANTCSLIGDEDKADSLFRKACAIEPPSGYAFYCYGEFLYEHGDTVGYNNQIDKALRQDNLDFDIKMNLLRTSTQNLFADTTQEARINNLFAVMLEQHPHEGKLRDLYASYLYAASRYEESAEQFSYVLDSDPSDLDRWVSVVAIYNSAEEWAKALDVVNRAMNYFPSSPRLYSLRSGIYNVTGHNEQAIADMRKAIACADSADVTTASQCRASLADIYQKLGNADSACVNYDRALAINPDNILALNNYAYFLSTINRDLDKALDMALKVINAEPDNNTYVDTYAWILYQKGEYFQAKQYIDKVLSDANYERSSEVLEHAAAIYEKVGDADKASQFAEMAKVAAAREKEEEGIAREKMNAKPKQKDSPAKPNSTKTKKKKRK